MRRILALTLALAFTGCGKETGSSAPAPVPPVSTNQQGPSDAGPINPATVGTITGVVKLEGWLKPDAPVPLGGIVFCAACHPKGPPPGDSLVMGEGQTMANVFVCVKNGLGNRSFPVPTEPVKLDQVGCIYTPHVLAIRANQPLLVHNSDDIMHNVKGAPALNRSFNDGQTTRGAENTYRFPIQEPAIFVKCDIHPWMGAWLHVVAHPFFQVTGKDGRYKIEGLPPGEYEIQAWHERFPNNPLIVQVKLEAKATVTQDFTFKGGTKPDSKK